jgi:hypothetical protein
MPIDPLTYSLAHQWIKQHGFDERESFYSTTGEHLHDKLSLGNIYHDETEFVMVTVMDRTGNYLHNNVGYMFEDDSLIVDTGDEWAAFPPNGYDPASGYNFIEVDE